MSAEPTVNFNIQGNVNQAAAKIENSNSHIGDVNNYGNQIPTVDEVLDSVLQAIPEASRDEIANGAASHNILDFCARVPARKAELGPGSHSESRAFD